MRIFMKSTTRAKTVAKALRRSLGARGRATKLSECQEITAKIFGYDNWHALTKLHASFPPSLDDAEAPSKRGYRRQRYGAVLLAHGVSADQVASILDEIRPTDRTPLRLQDSLPRFLIQGFEIDADGKRLRSLGFQDLTAAAVEIMLPHRSGPACAFPELPTIYSISTGLTDEARRVGFDGRLALQGLHAKLAEFLAAIGSKEALPAFRERLQALRQATWSLENARTEQVAVEHAAFSNDFASHGMFFSDHLSPEYCQSVDAMYDDWGLDEYTKRHPRPPFDEGAPSAAWDTAYRAWIATNAPPFVFATTAMPWRGLDAADIRTRAEEDDREPDVGEMVSSSLEDHHEDAYAGVVDLNALVGIVHAWYPHAGKKNKIDLAFDNKVTAWNASQHIVSYYPDFKTILPSFEGKTKTDAVAWCSAAVDGIRQRLAALGKWDPPAAPAAANEDELALGQTP